MKRWERLNRYLLVNKMRVLVASFMLFMYPIIYWFYLNANDIALMVSVHWQANKLSQYIVNNREETSMVLAFIATFSIGMVLVSKAYLNDIGKQIWGDKSHQPHT